MTFAECPSCQSEIKLTGKPFMGQQVRCRSCDADLEVVWLDPVELDWVPEDDDDYNRYDDYSDESEESYTHYETGIEDY